MDRRKGPAPSQHRPIPNHNTTGVELTRPEDGYAAPDAQDRYEGWVLAEAQRLGYRLSARCIDCKHPIFSAASLARMRGPKCAARAGVTA